MSRYYSEIVFVQILATALVVLGHSYPFTIDIPSWLSTTQRFIYAFHMPLFVFISGYLLVYTRQCDKISAGKFVKKRFLKLLIPYIFLSLIALIPKYLVQGFLNDSMSLDGYSMLRVFLVPRENVWGHFWFLPMIFIQGVVGYAFDKAFTKTNSTIGWSILTVIAFIVYLLSFRKGVTQWLSLNDLASFSWVFSLGALSARVKFLDKLRSRANLTVSIISFALAIIVFNVRLIEPLLALKYALIAIIMIYSLTALCIVVSKHLNLDRNAVYAQTFTIFLLSWPCQAVANVLTERILHGPYWLIMPVQLMTGIAMPILLIILIDKIERKTKKHYISFILGK